MKLSLLSILALAACHPSTAVESNAASVCAAACTALADAGCPEANGLGGRTCLATCLHDTPAVVVDLHSSCVAAAHGAQAIRACGVGCAL